MLNEEQIMEKAKKARELADALKAKLDITVTLESRETYLKDYWFEKGKLSAYKEVINR